MAGDVSAVNESIEKITELKIDGKSVTEGS